MSLAVDLEVEHGPTPPLGDDLPRVPKAGLRVLHAVQEAHHVAPGQLCSSLLHNCASRERLGERHHVPEIPGREPSHLRV